MANGKAARARENRAKAHVPECAKHSECRKGLKQDLSCKKGACSCYKKPSPTKVGE